MIRLINKLGYKMDLIRALAKITSYC